MGNWTTTSTPPGVTPGTLTQAAFYPGALSDPTQGAWNSVGGPWIYYYGQPSYSPYQVGQVLFDGADGKLYRNSGYPNGWVKWADPADIIAGTIAAGVVLAGSANITSGTVTVTVDGTNYVRVTDSQSSYPCAAQLNNTGLSITTVRNSAQALLRIAQAGSANGELFLKSHDGSTSISLLPITVTNPSVALAGYLNFAINGSQNYYIPYYGPA